MTKKITVIILFFLISGCKTLEQKSVVKNLSLSKKRYRSIKNDKEIMNNLYVLIQDSLNPKKINKALERYFDNKDKNELNSSLELYRLFKGKNITITTVPIDSMDTTKVLRLDSFKEVEAFEQKLKKQTKKAKEEFNTTVKKDSLKY